MIKHLLKLNNPIKNKKVKNTMKKNAVETKNEYRIRSFMSNVNKLDMLVHRQTHSETFGTVKLIKAAYENNGKRKFSVSKSKLIPSGAYTFSSLRTKYFDALGCSA